METEELLAGEKICLNCGEKFKSGRADKLYCSQECKTDYNNKQKATKPKPIVWIETPYEPQPLPLQNIIDILVTNRAILYGLCSEERAGHISMRDLEKKGFNRHFMTSQDNPNKNGHVYRFCFEYGYRVDPDGTAVIICRPREIDLS